MSTAGWHWPTRRTSALIIVCGFLGNKFAMVREHQSADHTPPIEFPTRGGLPPPAPQRLQVDKAVITCALGTARLGAG